MSAKLMSNDAWMLTPSKKASSPIEGLVLKPKSEVSECRCGQAFSKMVVKKHNCRACGDVFCGNCRYVEKFRVITGYNAESSIHILNYYHKILTFLLSAHSSVHPIYLLNIQ